MFFGLFKRKSKSDNALKPLKVMRPGFKHRLKAAKKKQYRAEVALTYNGKPLRQFEVLENGYSRDIVAKNIDENLGFKVLSVVENKKKKAKR